MVHGCAMAETCKFTQYEVLRVAVEAKCDPRTVRAYLAGAKQNGNTRARDEDGLRAAVYADAVVSKPTGGE